MKLVVTILLMMGMASAQVFVGGQGKVIGKGILQPLGSPPPPPPPLGLQVSFFAGSWNKGNPVKWPPTDGTGANLVVSGARLWDDGMKWGQIETANGTWGTAFTSTMTSFINTMVPAYPMDVMYTFGDTPAWAAMPGTDGTTTSTACATPQAGSCLPPIGLDVNSVACNADGSASASQVHADCAGGANTIWRQAVYHIVSTFKGKIKYYECWNEPDGAGNFWTNSSNWGGKSTAPTAANQAPLVRLVNMCADLQQIVHQIDPAARVGSPSFHGPTALTWMHYFSTTTATQSACTGSCSAAIGGATWSASTVTGATSFDVTIAHLRGSGTGTGEGSGNADPANFITAYNNAKTEIINDRLPPLLFDDEWGPVNQTTTQTPTADFLAYFVAAGLSLRAGVTVDGYLQREWYYQIDANSSATQVSQVQGNVAGTAWNKVVGWWVGSTPTAKCSNVGTTWTCPLKLAGVKTAEIKWNEATISVNLSSAANTLGGNTSYACSTSCAGIVAGEYVTISGFTQPADNGSFIVQSSTSSTLVVNNTAGVANSAPGFASYTPVMCGTGCALVSADGFATWTDLKGVVHTVTSNQVPLGAKAVLLQ